MKKLTLATLAALLVSSSISFAQNNLTPKFTTAIPGPAVSATLAPAATLPPYVGIGIVLKTRYLKIENALADLVKQKGRSNVTAAMALDATARAAVPTLPANATAADETKAMDAYMHSATYSGDVAAECYLIFAGSPAEQAGIQQHDQIVAVDNKPITGLDAAGLVKLIKSGAAGSSVDITVVRAEKDGSKSSHTYTIVRRTVVPIIP